MKTAAGAASPSIYLCNNKGNSVSVSCQIKILVSVCHLPENFCTLSMTRSILTVPFAFLINVSSLILSWNSGLAAAHNDCPCRNCSPWDRYAQANETRSACVRS